MNDCSTSIHSVKMNPSPADGGCTGAYVCVCVCAFCSFLFVRNVSHLDVSQFFTYVGWEQKKMRGDKLKLKWVSKYIMKHVYSVQYMRSCHIVVECKQVPLKMSQAVRYFLSVHIYAVAFWCTFRTDISFAVLYCLLPFIFTSIFRHNVTLRPTAQNAFRFVYNFLRCIVALESFSVASKCLCLPRIFRLLVGLFSRNLLFVLFSSLQMKMQSIFLTFKSHEKPKTAHK